MTKCHDCRVDTRTVESVTATTEGWLPGRAEIYMLRDPVWREAAPDDPDDPWSRVRFVLCVGCVEDRLGRELTADDFTDCPVNDLTCRDDPCHVWSYRTQRLVDRMTR